MSEFKVYTKTGDKGSTSLIGGTRVSKSDERIEAYGTVDELISYMGLLRDLIEDKNLHDNIVIIQDRLMTAASILATDCKKCPRDLPKLFDEDVSFLEEQIDQIDETLPPLNSFILPGGHQTVSFTHISRTICRRAERRVLKLDFESEDIAYVVKYLNRLSDYLFVLARKLSVILNVNEIAWQAKL